MNEMARGAIGRDHDARLVACPGAGHLPEGEALELLVHIDYYRALQEHYAIPVSFDERQVLHVDRGDLPEDWMSPGAIPTTQALGDAWVRSNASVLLAVPSAVIPQELNYLFNPKHPQAGSLTLGEPQPFRYDPRLLKLRPADT